MGLMDSDNIIVLIEIIMVLILLVVNIIFGKKYKKQKIAWEQNKEKLQKEKLQELLTNRRRG